MARLIIGHVSSSSVRIWVRGDRRYPHAIVQVSGPSEGTPTSKLHLEERHGFTGVIEVKGLSASTDYHCQVQFAKAATSPPRSHVDYGHCRGKFRTAPGSRSAEPFSFLLGSCNLHSLGIISSPDRAFEELLDKAEERAARFMIHCGDQIYYDVPLWYKAPDIQEYRDKYLDAWGDSRTTRRFLTQLPQYMIMDDHEITNNFANDFDSPSTAATPRMFKQISMKVYREFVDIRHPARKTTQGYWYEFQYGNARFFVMDTRTERWNGRGHDGQMIDAVQMRALKRWLTKNKDRLKFIVTSVPFVGEVRNNNDKWTAMPFASQRGEILDHIGQRLIRRVVFLTGDMHNSYHATLTIDAQGQDLIIHELMSSPVNQLEKSPYHLYETGVQRTTPGHRTFVSEIAKKEFYCDHSNAMLIEVDKASVGWEIFRTKKSKKGTSGSFTV